MSQENVELVRALVGLWNAGERSVSALAQYCDAAAELESPLSSVVGEPYRGHIGMERWLVDLDEQFADWRISLEDVRDVGDQVVSIGTVDARGRSSGIPLQFRSATVLDFGANRLITRVRIYADVDEALRAVGLEE